MHHSLPCHLPWNENRTSYSFHWTHKNKLLPAKQKKYVLYTVYGEKLGILKNIVYKRGLTFFFKVQSIFTCIIPFQINWKYAVLVKADYWECRFCLLLVGWRVGLGNTLPHALTFIISLLLTSHSPSLDVWGAACSLLHSRSRSEKAVVRLLPWWRIEDQWWWKHSCRHLVDWPA